MDSDGVTYIAPVGSTLPMPSMLISLAKSVFHDSNAAWPGAMVLGVAVSIAVGAGADGGGTGVGLGGCFLEHAMTANKMAVARTKLIH